ncbi:MAG: transglycosylase SLT domain-containing protein [Flavihumibacter sp.]|nr:transglycosylase SLT domain-containing protein [Flavihumibacter sp.]
MQSELFTKIQKTEKAKLNLIDKIFTSYKLPGELKYLAIVESEMKSSATSRVGALGVWQLMPSTAMDLGLRVDSTTNVYTCRKVQKQPLFICAIYTEPLTTGHSLLLRIIVVPAPFLKPLKKPAPITIGIFNNTSQKRQGIMSKN